MAPIPQMDPGQNLKMMLWSIRHFASMRMEPSDLVTQNTFPISILPHTFLCCCLADQVRHGLCMSTDLGLATLASGPLAGVEQLNNGRPT